MKLYKLTRTQILHISLDEAWAFFSNPRNLNEITPNELRFVIVSDPGDQMYAGQIIEYRIQLMQLFWQGWVTEIKHVEPYKSFVDEQRAGPYAFWHHRHVFEKVGDVVRMTDTVHYALGFSFIGQLVHRYYVRPMLERIFAYRYQVLEERFNLDRS